MSASATARGRALTSEEAAQYRVPKEYNQAVALQSQLVRKYFEDLAAAAAKGKKMAYGLVEANPIEILRLFDIPAVYPEVFSLQISYKGGALPLMLAAENEGYSTDCCSYVKSGVAAVPPIGTGQTPLGYVPKPDIAVLTYSGCQIYIHWWEQYHYWTGAKIFTLDIPYVRDYERDRYVPRHDVRYVADQLMDVISQLEQITGIRYSEEKLREILTYSADAWDHWRMALEMGKKVPSPLDGYFEAIYYMSLITLTRGDKTTADYYRFLVDELQRRAEAGIGPTPEEQFRLVFEGVPNYPYYKDWWSLFKRWNARGVVGTYPKVTGVVDYFRFNPDRPIETIAEYMIHAYCNWNMLMRADLLKYYVDAYKADGVVIHSIKSCRSFSMGQGDFKEYFVGMDVPTLMLESDHVDPRYYSDAQMRNRIDAFFESLALRKGLK